jgi:hypothetical protein
MIKNLIIIILILLVFLILHKENFNTNESLFIKPNDTNLNPIDLYNIKENSYTNNILDNNFININNIETETYNKNQDNTQQIYKNRINMISNNWIISDTLKNDNIECCLVSKDLNNFKYNFKKLSNNACDINLYNINNDRQLLFDNINNWSNNYCSNDLDNQILGSCRRNNFECVDFIDKDTCDNFNGVALSPMKQINKKLEWNKQICNLPIYKSVSFDKNN